MRASIAQRILYVGGWFASSCSIIFTNKFLLTDRHFHFPFTLAAATNMVVFCGAWLLTRPVAQRPEPLSWRTGLTIGECSRNDPRHFRAAVPRAHHPAERWAFDSRSKQSGR